MNKTCKQEDIQVVKALCTGLYLDSVQSLKDTLPVFSIKNILRRPQTLVAGGDNQRADSAQGGPGVAGPGVQRDTTDR